MLPELTSLILLDAVSSGEDVGSVDQASTADKHVVELLLLQDGHLPWVLSCIESKR